jgi:hypothetical protein
VDVFACISGKEFLVPVLLKYFEDRDKSIHFVCTI